jgi:hypothetical protein
MRAMLATAAGIPSRLAWSFDDGLANTFAMDIATEKPRRCAAPDSESLPKRYREPTNSKRARSESGESQAAFSIGQLAKRRSIVTKLCFENSATASKIGRVTRLWME